MTTQTFTKNGTKATTATTLPKAVFTVVPENYELLKLAYTAYLANGRETLAKTKTRGLVRGGGKKPWRQKGTGRARFGSSRNPIWRGGGIAFGPTGEENHSLHLNTKAKKTALRQALSLAAKEGSIKVLEAFEPKDGKVATTAQLLDKISATGSILLVVSQKGELVERATRNLPNLKVSQANYLTVYDILNSDTIVIGAPALEMIDAWLGSKAS